jgi:hypothetical protein
MSNKDRTYGLGLFERIFIITLLVIFVVGIATMMGQPVPGLALGLLVFGFTIYVGFVEWWALAPTLLIGFLYLTWRSGN